MTMKAMNNSTADTPVNVRFEGLFDCNCEASPANVFPPLAGGTEVVSEFFGESGDPHVEQKTASLSGILFPQFGQLSFFLGMNGISRVPQLLQNDDVSSMA